MFVSVKTLWHSKIRAQDRSQMNQSQGFGGGVSSSGSRLRREGIAVG